MLKYWLKNLKLLGMSLIILGGMCVQVVAQVPSNWAQAGVKVAIEKQLIPVELQNHYKMNITREHFAELLHRLIEVVTQKDMDEILKIRGIDSIYNPFKDTQNEKILPLYQLGIVNGKEQGAFVPEGELTRQEAAGMLFKTAQVLGYSNVFSRYNIYLEDDTEIAEWAKEAVYYVVSNGIMKGTDKNQFAPNQKYTREQAYLTMLNTAEYMKKPLTAGESIRIGDKTIVAGESVQDVIKKFGEPQRIDKGLATYDMYVYNKDYSEFLIVGIREEKVVAFMTTSTPFTVYGEVSYGDKEVQLRDGSQVFRDSYRDNQVHGVWYQAPGEHYLYNLDTLLQAKEAIELQGVDCVNAFRNEKGLPIVEIDKGASIAARKHSQDMADKNYFEHNSLDGNAFDTRYYEAGGKDFAKAENISAGYYSAIDSFNGWINSKTGHRKPIENEDIHGIGVGFGVSRNSEYGVYMTQVFSISRER